MAGVAVSGKRRNADVSHIPVRWEWNAVGFPFPVCTSARACMPLFEWYRKGHFLHHFLSVPNRSLYFLFMPQLRGISLKRSDRQNRCNLNSLHTVSIQHGTALSFAEPGPSSASTERSLNAQLMRVRTCSPAFRDQSRRPRSCKRGNNCRLRQAVQCLHCSVWAAPCYYWPRLRGSEDI